MKSIKIVIIGGGSGYTPELVNELINRYKKMPVSEVWLVDVEEGQEKQQIVASLARRMVSKAKLDFPIYTTINRTDALENADYVITQFRAGQMSSRMIDERIPLKYNSIGQETNGAGELMYAFRMIPVMLELVKEMETYCPNAWLLNFANPASILSEAVLNHSNWKRIISICNGPLNMEYDIAKILNVERERLYVTFVGLNHLIFAKEIYLDGVDITDKVVSLVADKNCHVDNPGVSPWDEEFLKGLGMLPMSYLQYYWKTSEVVKEEHEAANITGTRAVVAKQKENELFEVYKDEGLDTVPELLYSRGGSGYSRCACNLLYSIYSDKRDVQTVNTANCGALKELRDSDVVEVNCLITNHGPIPLTTGEVPSKVQGIITQVKTFERLVCEAAVAGDYHKALVALTVNPLIPSDNEARKMLDEMLILNKEYLPQFHIK